MQVGPDRRMAIWRSRVPDLTITWRFRPENRSI